VACRVVGVAEAPAINCYRVRWDRSADATSAGDVSATESSTESIRPRLLINFVAEDPFLYARRVAEACQLRAWTEATIRYHLLVDCMPTDGMPELPPEAVARVSERALASGRLADQLLPCKLLVREVQVSSHTEPPLRLPLLLWKSPHEGALLFAWSKSSFGFVQKLAAALPAPHCG
jgi:hypothetical protein